jgi:hypothetical protein
MKATNRHFRTLGLNRRASFAEVKLAYKKLVKVWHPDLYVAKRPGMIPKVQEKFKEINFAYSILCEAFQEISFEQTKNTNDHNREKDSAKQFEFEFSNGDHYVGEALDGKMHGLGIYYFACGDVYKGEFVSGFRNGLGFYIHSTGSQYQGQFYDGKPNGNGVYNYSNGDRYEGEFVEEEMCGTGVYYYYGNGSQFIGQFKYGKPHGYGQYVAASGKVVGGHWVDGSLI